MIVMRFNCMKSTFKLRFVDIFISRRKNQPKRFCFKGANVLRNWYVGFNHMPRKQQKLLEYLFISGRQILDRVKLGLKSFLQSTSRLLKMSRKPTKKEFWLSLKITFLGTILIGGIGFVIKFISSMIQGISV